MDGRAVHIDDACEMPKEWRAQLYVGTNRTHASTAEGEMEAILRLVQVAHVVSSELLGWNKHGESNSRT